VTVLVLRALGLGDLLTAVPALRGIRRAFPDDHVVLATPAALAALAYATGAVDEVLPASGLAPLDFALTRDNDFALTRDKAFTHDNAFIPDIAVNLHGRGPQSHRLLAELTPGRLLGFRCPEAGYSDGPRWVPGEYEVARWCRMLAGHGIEACPGDLGLPAPASLRPGCVVVHPGAAHPRRRWPAERFALVAAALANMGEDVVISGSSAEARRAREVADRAGLPRTAVLAGCTDVLALAGLVAAARLVICGDTGVAHLATAFATPSVVLFGPVSPAEWGPPPGRPQHVALWSPGADGHVTGAGDGAVDDGAVDRVLLATGAEDVLAAAERLLATQEAVAQEAATQEARPSTVPGLSSTPVR
jgi:ADP-heptose:LPS heptosyltransferase